MSRQGFLIGLACIVGLTITSVVKVIVIGVVGVKQVAQGKQVELKL